MYDTYQVTGLKPVDPSYASPNMMEVGASAAPEGAAGLLHPDNPLLWLGVFLAVTFGLVGVSGSARLGKAKASASLGKE